MQEWAKQCLEWLKSDKCSGRPSNIRNNEPVTKGHHLVWNDRGI